MEIEVRTPPVFPDNREALAEFLRGLGYEPSMEPPIEKRSVGEDSLAFVLWLGTAVGAAVATDLAHAVAGWIREHLPKRRRGGTVRIIYGPDDKPLAEVPIEEEGAID